MNCDIRGVWWELARHYKGMHTRHACPYSCHDFWYIWHRWSIYICKYIYIINIYWCMIYWLLRNDMRCLTHFLSQMSNIMYVFYISNLMQLKFIRPHHILHILHILLASSFWHSQFHHLLNRLMVTLFLIMFFHKRISGSFHFIPAFTRLADTVAMGSAW